MRYTVAHAYEFTTTDIFEIQARLIAFRDPLMSMQRDAYVRLCVREVIDRIDRDTMKNPFNVPVPPFSSYIQHYRDEVRDRQKKIKATGLRDVEVDFEFIVQVFPYEGKFYGRIVTEQDVWREALVATGLLVEASPHLPESAVPDDASRQREADWVGIIERDPANLLFGLDANFPPLTLYEFVPTPELLAEATPSPTRRARKIAMDRVARRFHETLTLQSGIKGETEKEYSFGSFSSVHTAYEYARSEQGQQEVEELIPSIRDRLLPFTVKTIMGT